MAKTYLKSVPDTNILLAAEMRPSSASSNKEYFARWRNEEFAVLYSEDTFLEYIKKLREKGLPEDAVDRFLGVLLKLGVEPTSDTAPPYTVADVVPRRTPTPRCLAGGDGEIPPPSGPCLAPGRLAPNPLSLLPGSPRIRASTKSPSTRPGKAVIRVPFVVDLRPRAPPGGSRASAHC